MSDSKHISEHILKNLKDPKFWENLTGIPVDRIELIDLKDIPPPCLCTPCLLALSRTKAMRMAAETMGPTGEFARFAEAYATTKKSKKVDFHFCEKEFTLPNGRTYKCKCVHHDNKEPKDVRPS